jgi:hypothetical protein
VNTTALESRKRQRVGRGHDFTEPADVHIGREVAGKKVVIGQTHRFGQVWTEMVVLWFSLCFFFLFSCRCFWLEFSLSLFCLFANAMLPLVF